jgi:hypothetical protein
MLAIILLLLFLLIVSFFGLALAPLLLPPNKVDILFNNPGFEEPGEGGGELQFISEELLAMML